jgi:fatty-acid peroxygenase
LIVAGISHDSRRNDHPVFASVLPNPDGEPERSIPHDGALDSSIAFMRDGYLFIAKRCERLGSDIFRTRIMLTPAICMRGAEAARLFYGGERFTRIGAMPKPTLRLLQDEGSVQLMEGAAHHRRKAMFMSMMGPGALASMTALFAEEWDKAVARWRRRGHVVLHNEFGELLTRAAIRWAGLPLPETEVGKRMRELTAMIEFAGSIGPDNWWAQYLRRRGERWAQAMIAGLRSRGITVAVDSPAGIIARHTDIEGAILSGEVAAVELLNVVRPVVAVARFMTFAAHALHEHPIWRERFAAGDERDISGLVHEVRRFYPFFPAIGGRVIQPFTWRGYAFEENEWVLLDLYGTNHDARQWPEPESFYPERFRDWQGDPFTLIPQGGGGFDTGHRCPGEWLTIDLVREAVRQLARTPYSVPTQNLSISLRRMPALPASGFIINL